MQMLKWMLASWIHLETRPWMSTETRKANFLQPILWKWVSIFTAHTNNRSWNYSADNFEEINTKALEADHFVDGHPYLIAQSKSHALRWERLFSFRDVFMGNDSTFAPEIPAAATGSLAGSLRPLREAIIVLFLLWQCGPSFLLFWGNSLSCSGCNCALDLFYFFNCKIAFDCCEPPRGPFWGRKAARNYYFFPQMNETTQRSEIILPDPRKEAV